MRILRDPAVDPTAGDFSTLTKSITDLTTKADTFVTKEELQPIAKALGEVQHSIKVRDLGEDDPKRGFRHAGDFAKAVMEACSPEHQFKVDDRLKALTKAPSGASQNYDPSVGFLFPPGFIPGVGDTSEWSTESLLNSGVTNIPIDPSQNDITLTVRKDADRTAGIGGGFFAYWKDEADALTNTQGKLRQLTLRPSELYAFSYATDKSLRNSPIALGQWLTSGMREAIDFKIGDTIVNGDGVGKPIGLLNSPSVISVAKETSQTATTINEVNLAKMWSRMPASFRNQAVWLMNQDCETQLDLMARAAYGVSATINPNIDTILYDRGANTLKGRPIVYTEYCATLGTVGDIILWCPRKYYVATKAGQGPEMSIHLRFNYAESAFRYIFEIDGKSALDSALTPYKGSTTTSPFVVLSTAT